MAILSFIRSSTYKNALRLLEKWSLNFIYPKFSMVDLSPHDILEVNLASTVAVVLHIMHGHEHGQGTGMI